MLETHEDFRPSIHDIASLFSPSIIFLTKKCQFQTQSFVWQRGIDRETNDKSYFPEFIINILGLAQRHQISIHIILLSSYLEHQYGNESPSNRDNEVPWQKCEFSLTPNCTSEHHSLFRTTMTENRFSDSARAKTRAPRCVLTLYRLRAVHDEER